MKLIKEEISKRWNLVNEFSLNKEFIKEVWCFYSLYDLSCAICKNYDSNYNKKNVLIQKFIETQDIRYYNKLKRYMLVDVGIINNAMDIIEDIKSGGVQTGDFKKPTMFAININE